MNVILDACAIVALFKNDETEAIDVNNIVMDTDNTLYIHAVNACEAYYEPLKAGKPEAEADKVLQFLHDNTVIVREDMDIDFWRKAGYFKGKYPLALGDAFGLALADRLGCEFVTKDAAELKKVAMDGEVRIRFLNST